MSAFPDRSPDPRPRSEPRPVPYNPQSEVPAISERIEPCPACKGQKGFLREPHLAYSCRWYVCRMCDGQGFVSVASPQSMDLEARLAASLRALNVRPPDHDGPKCSWCGKAMLDTQALTLDRDRHRRCERMDVHCRKQYGIFGVDDIEITHDPYQGHVAIKMGREQIYIPKDAMEAVRDVLYECAANQKDYDTPDEDEEDRGDCA